MKKILITGNQGYIGPIVSEKLKKASPDSMIIGLDTGFFSNCSNSKLLSPDHYVDLQINKDVRDVNEDDFIGVDSVIYLSAISNDPMGSEFESVTGEINNNCAIKCAILAKNAGVKSFVFASSCSVYGAAGDGLMRDENSELNPVTAYAISKIEAEKGLEPLADDSFVITCLRFATACGYSPRLRLDLVLNDFVSAAIVNKEINILSDGTPWRPLIHVKDMALAMQWAINRSVSPASFLALNVGSESWNYQVKDLAEAVALLIPGTNVKINKDAAPDKRSYKVSFKLFTQLAPDFLPKVTLNDAIVDLYKGITSFLGADSQISKSNTIRLFQLRELLKSNEIDKELKWNK